MDIRKIKIRNVEADHQTFYALIWRNSTYHPWVVATVDSHSLHFNEWYWGSYYETYPQALKAFNEKKSYVHFVENANELRPSISA